MLCRSLSVFCRGVIVVMNSAVLFGMEQGRITTLTRLVEVAQPYARKHFNEGKVIYFDGNDGFNQCHLNALMVTLYAQNSFDGLDKKQQKFLTYNLLTSIPLGFASNEGPDRMEKFFDITFNRSLQKGLRSSKSKVREEINDYILDTKREFFDQHNEVKWKDCSFIDPRGGRFNLPKFVGVEFFLREINKNQMPLVVKCAVYHTDEIRRMQTFFVMPNQTKSIPVSPNDIDTFIDTHMLDTQSPVIVIEGIACMEDEPCDENSYMAHLQRFQAIDSNLLQLINAAEWTRKRQSEAKDHMLSGQKERYEFYLKESHKVCSSWDENKTFLIAHMYSDTLADAMRYKELQIL